MIQTTTLDFLDALNQNNDRLWFHANKDFYLSAQQDFLALVEQVLEGLRQFDQSLAMMTAKECVFRIHRDVRFAKNKHPFKPFFGAFFSPFGKNFEGAGIYLHIQPNGQSMVAGGSYCPPKELLQPIRSHIAADASALRTIISATEFVENFGQLQGEMLKTAPKNYPKDHPAIDLLRYKSFIAMKLFTDKEVLGADFVKKILMTAKACQPLNLFLNAPLIGQS